MIKRRDFLISTSMASLMAFILPQIVEAAMPKTLSLKLNNDDIILFQGDSITDAGRKKEDNNFNNPTSLGSG